MTQFTFSNIADAGDGLPALESCAYQQDQDTAFIQANNRYYRYFAASSAVADGQSIVRPSTFTAGDAGRWIRQGPPGSVRDPAQYEIPTDQAFDFIIGSREDLIAVAGGPVAGVFTLPAGSYAVVRSFSLNTDETLLVDGVEVALFGFRGVTITGDSSSALLLVDNAGTFKGFGFVLDQDNLSSSAISLANASELVLEQCRVLAGGDSDGVVLNGASLAYIVQTDLIGAPALGILSGTARVSESNLNSIVSASALFSMSGVAYVENSNLNSITTGAAVQFIGGEGYFTNCSFTADTAADVIQPGLGIMQISGGRIAGNGSNIGIDVSGIESLVVQGTRFETLDTGIFCDGSTPEKVVLDSLTMSVTTVGVDWLAANVPTNGLLETSIVQNSGAGFANHTEADARVNRKACTNGGALLAETPIVP